MQHKFVLTAGDDDSILAGKLYVHKHPECIHLSAGRKFKDLEEGSEVIFIRPWIHPRELIDPARYGKYKLTLFHSVGSLAWEYRHELEQVGITCLWLDQDESFCKHVWTHLYGHTDYPLIVSYVHDYMKWELKMDESIDIHYGLSIVPAKFSQEASAIYVKFIEGDKASMQRLSLDGVLIREYVDHILNVLGKELIFSTQFDDLNILAANCPLATSHFFANYPLYCDNDLSMVFFMDVKNNAVRHTVYRISPELVMSDVVAAHGGRGNQGVASFTAPKLAIGKSSECVVTSIDYNELFEPVESPDCIRQYIQLNYLLNHSDIASVKYRGKRAMLANTPYLTRINMFSNIRRLDEEIGVTVCMQSDQRYRIAVINLDGTDPGPEYGELFGNYRIRTNEGIVEGLESESLVPDLFK